MQIPFKLVYGLEVVVPMEYLVPSLRIVSFTDMDETGAIHERLAQLVKLEEEKFIAVFHQQIQKEREKAYHDRHIKKKIFKQGDLVLLYTVSLSNTLGSLERIGLDHMRLPMLQKEELRN